MGPLTVILGSEMKSNDAPGRIRVVTPRGDVLSMHKKDVVHTSNADAGGDLKRYAIGADAPVSIETTGAALQGMDFANRSIFGHVYLTSSKGTDDKTGVIDGHTGR